MSGPELGQSGFGIQTTSPNPNFSLQSCDGHSQNLFDNLPRVGVPCFVSEKWLKFLTPTPTDTATAAAEAEAEAEAEAHNKPHSEVNLEGCVSTGDV